MVDGARDRIDPSVRSAQAKVESVLMARIHPAQTLVEMGVVKGDGHSRSTAPSPGLRLVFPSSSGGSGFAAGIADRPSGCSFGSARCAGTIDQRRETRCQPGVALPRAPGAAFRGDVYACGVAGTVRNATVTSRAHNAPARPLCAAGCVRSKCPSRDLCWHEPEFAGYPVLVGGRIVFSVLG